MRTHLKEIVELGPFGFRPFLADVPQNLDRHCLAKIFPAVHFNELSACQPGIDDQLIHVNLMEVCLASQRIDDAWFYVKLMREAGQGGNSLSQE